MMASDIAIGGFAECSGPIGLISTLDLKPPPRLIPAVPRCLTLTLSGAIGPDQPINLATVQRQLAGQTFDCVEMSITSTGGSSKESIAIFHFLRSLPVPIKAIAKRFCLSGGLVIFMAASLRVMELGTELLIHPTNCDRNELPSTVTAEILRAQADALAEIDAMVASIFATRTGFSPTFFEAEKNTESGLSEADALASGVVHEICGGLTEKCEPGLPDLIARVAADPAVYVPPRLLTANFCAACYVAQFFPRSPGS